MACTHSGGVGGVNPQQRTALLEQVLELWRRQGWRIESRHEFKATIAKGKEHEGLSDFLLIVFTFGLRGGVKRRTIAVDESGRVLQHKA